MSRNNSKSHLDRVGAPKNLPPSNNLLMNMGVTIDPGTIAGAPKSINLRKLFVLGENVEGVSISYMCPKFLGYLDRALSEKTCHDLGAEDRLQLRRYRTTRRAADRGKNGIISATSRSEGFVTLYQIWICLKTHPKPTPGSILEVGMPNVFYVHEIIGSHQVTRTVSVIEDWSDLTNPGWAITFSEPCPEDGIFAWPEGSGVWFSQYAA